MSLLSPQRMKGGRVVGGWVEAEGMGSRGGSWLGCCRVLQEHRKPRPKRPFEQNWKKIEKHTVFFNFFLIWLAMGCLVTRVRKSQKN